MRAAARLPRGRGWWFWNESREEARPFSCPPLSTLPVVTISRHLPRGPTRCAGSRRGGARSYASGTNEHKRRAILPGVLWVRSGLGRARGGRGMDGGREKSSSGARGKGREKQGEKRRDRRWRRFFFSSLVCLVVEIASRDGEATASRLVDFCAFFLG